MPRPTPALARPRSAPKEILRILARAARSGLITVPGAAEALGVGHAQAATALASLARRGWVARARRGLYLVLPLEAAGSSATVDDPWVLAQVLFVPCYVAGWSAAEHWGLTEQLFRPTFVATAATIRTRSQRVLGLEFRLARVAPARLSAATTVWRGREQVAVSDAAGTIADALVAPSWVGGVRHLAHMLATYRASKAWDPATVVARLEAVGSGAAFKRLGYLVETLHLDAPALVNAALERRTAGIIRLDPDLRAQRRLTKRWGLWVNVRLDNDEDLA
jgi:predicted transcriptional regulator of viral defense system